MTLPVEVQAVNIDIYIHCQYRYLYALKTFI